MIGVVCEGLELDLRKSPGEIIMKTLLDVQLSLNDLYYEVVGIADLKKQDAILAHLKEAQDALREIQIAEAEKNYVDPLS